MDENIKLPDPVAYSTIRTALINMDIQLLLKLGVDILEQSIHTKYDIGGPRRICWFSNAHTLEEYCLNTAADLLKKIITSYYMLAAKHRGQEVITTIINSLSLSYTDDTHENFHGKKGTYLPDIKAESTIEGVNTITVEVKNITPKYLSAAQVYEADIVLLVPKGTTNLQVYYKADKINIDRPVQIIWSPGSKKSITYYLYREVTNFIPADLLLDPDTFSTHW